MSWTTGIAMSLPMVSTFGPLDGPMYRMWTISAISAPSSAGWSGANSARYVPIIVPATCVAKRMWWANGSTVSASYNIDAGIYLDAGYKPGTKLVSTGSTAQGTASQVQFADITDTTLAPGLYWLALASESTSATFFRLSLSAASDAFTSFYQTSAFALPSSATPAESSTTPILAVFGFATTASP